MTPSALCIIGSGYSAAALVLHLDARGAAMDGVTVIGPQALGAGQAFGCINDDFRLNVRAELMQLWPDDPGHFANWAETHISGDEEADTDVGSFYRRQDFATYIADEIAARPTLETVSHIKASATGITSAGGIWHINLDNGSTAGAARVVLATGNPPPVWPFSEQIGDTPTLIRVPWRGDWAGSIESDARIVVIGSGLTALDALHTLRSRRHRGSITLVAPDGLLPPVQTGWSGADALEWPQDVRASGFLKFMRDTVGDIPWEDTEWQRRFESLRYHISAAWQRLDPADQGRLMRRFGWLWSLARFRAGPQAFGSATDAARYRDNSTLSPTWWPASRRPDGGTHSVGLATGARISADAVINCSGAGRDPLITSILDNGTAARHQTVRHRPAMTSGACADPGGWHAAPQYVRDWPHDVTCSR
ncbi:MAG: hypothetical protein CM15mP115_01610 [Alphaproteobacteria bacterium]|nr:MAG: hypothetical protein CM15mP115_01610 [Alphaproteobacteria bacterium]